MRALKCPGSYTPTDMFRMAEIGTLTHYFTHQVEADALSRRSADIINAIIFGVHNRAK